MPAADEHANDGCGDLRTRSRRLSSRALRLPIAAEDDPGCRSQELQLDEAEPQAELAAD